MKLKDLILAVLAGCDKVMTMFIPLAVALLLLSATSVSVTNAWIVLSIALCSTLFRGIKVWIK